MNGHQGPARVWTAAAAELTRTAGGRGNPLRGRVVHDLDLGPGRIGGRVRTARERDAEVAIGWDTVSEDRWVLASERLAGRARWFVALLDGAVDDALCEELAGIGIELAPATAAMTVSCDRDGAGWCLHARALHHAAAARIARDPAILLLLAGAPREVLLARVRAILGLHAPVASEGPRRPAVAPDPMDLATVVVSPAPPGEVMAVLDGLGAPPGIEDVAALGPIVRAAAAFAWAIAAGEGEEEADRQLLVATLRAGGTMTVPDLAAALGADEDVVERELERLHAEGAALRTGTAGLHRYRAR